MAGAVVQPGAVSMDSYSTCSIEGRPASQDTSKFRGLVHDTRWPDIAAGSLQYLIALECGEREMTNQDIQDEEILKS